MSIKTKRNIGLVLWGFLSFCSCDSNDIKRGELNLTSVDTLKQIVVRTEGTHINALNLLIKGDISGSGHLSIGDNDSVFYKTYDVKDGQNEIRYEGDWYSEFCYVTFRQTTKASGLIKVEADFVGD